MRRFLAVAVTLALAACAATPSPAPLAAADPKAPACHRETPTGSNVWHTVCTHPQDSDADNQRAVVQAQEMVQHSPAVRAGAKLGSND